MIISQLRQMAFYVKSRPQEADIKDLVLKHDRVFIGYPPFRQNCVWNRSAVRSCLLDVSVAEKDWHPQAIEAGWYRRYKRQISRNRNMALQVAAGSMVVVPRPTDGLCYIGRVVAPFEVEDAPSWADEYLNLRKAQGLSAEAQDERYHIGDVVQGWRVERWEPVPFPLIPRWIQYQVMGQTTLGEIHDRVDNRQALAVLTELYLGHRPPAPQPTNDLDEIVTRLRDWVSPPAFEHLMCDLLQREQSPIRWWHTGGSGDGGVDGIGIDQQGQVVGVLQCKWLLKEKPDALASKLIVQLQNVWGQGAKVYIATLVPRAGLKTSLPGVEVIGPKEAAGLLLSHRATCSLAQSLGIR